VRFAKFSEAGHDHRYFFSENTNQQKDIRNFKAAFNLRGFKGYKTIKRRHIKYGCEIFHLSLFALFLNLPVYTEGNAQDWFGEENPNSMQELSIDFGETFQYIPIRGYLQTPHGGEPGTTSKKRPTFKELNLESADSFYSSLHIRSNRHNFYGSIQLIHLSGDSVLDNELISQGVTYPAGSNVRADIELDLYRFGYQYCLIGGNHKEPSFEISPTIELAFFDFHYQLDGSGGLSTDRSYMKGAGRIGAEAYWYANDRLTVSASVIGPVPISDTPQIWTLELSAQYQLWGYGQRGGTVLVGIGYQCIEYEDDQTVPNHIMVEMSPILSAGLRIGF
jgi:hypothetical protein